MNGITPTRPLHSEILQNSIPFDITPRALPGVRPLDADNWLLVDDAFAGQMAYRAHLLANCRDRVLKLDSSARPAAEELLNMALDLFRRHPSRGYSVSSEAVKRPDGQEVQILWQDPLGTLGHLVQEDLCILEKRDDEHVMTGGLLCFPASWTLSEKFLRPLTTIHEPVASYDNPMAARVQRLFDGVQPGRPLWRFNRLWYDDPDLHQPRSIHEPRRAASKATTAPYLRSEKQCILRLPESRAVVFSIHSFVITQEAAARIT